MSGNQTGAADPLGAVKGFLAAAKDQDLQAMGGIFGDAEGAARDRIPRQELEQRELFMVRCLRHDRYDIVANAPSAGGGQTIAVNLSFKELTRSTSFAVVQGPERRWYVQKFEPSTLQDICVRRT